MPSLLEHAALVLADDCHRRGVRVSTLPLPAYLMHVVESAERAVRGKEAEKFPRASSAAEWAAAHGGASALAWALKREEVNKYGVYLCAGWSGDLPTVRLAIAHFGLDEFLCRGAEAGGKLSTLQWLRRNGCPWGDWTCYYAASEGHFEVLRWARENGCPWFSSGCASAAERNGHSEVARWVRENS